MTTMFPTTGEDPIIPPDPGDPTDGGTALLRAWVDVTWSHDPRNEPEHFEVSVFSGIDPLSNQIFAPVSVPGSCRRLIKRFWPQNDISDIHASVRAIYA